jgi:Leucine rich repeat
MLNVDNNQLSGALPPSSHSLYTSLGRLRVLNVANNSLTGTIPPQIGSLASLKQRLDLSSNSFGGVLPTELNLLTNLQRLVVSYNRLTGPVPDLFSLTKIKQLELEGNQFVGTMPNGTCGVVVANGATASADCTRAAGATNGTTTLLVCPCCTTCCVSVADSVCQTRAM